MELKLVREVTLLKLNSSIATLTLNREVTKEKVNNFNRRFDSIEKKQDKDANSHSRRFDVLKNLLTNLTNAIAHTAISCDPSPICERDLNFHHASSSPDRKVLYPISNLTVPLGNDYFSHENHDFDPNINPNDD